ncbi:MAG: rRNA pseudouridine synthase [Alphaproteobacteria bacterium]|jgi:23S rRNA pseudouridine2605 synthase|nr:rRNA pseudouridine synthase [Alphaproteobacteria bacterium]MCV6599026.1 rRNA pseudouridine synthase [Alphaproteobacteria bacterium]
MENKGERIAKVIARAGVCSRREAEKLIEQGRISINGKGVKTPATFVTDTDDIRFDGERIRKAEKTRLWVYYKPAGLICSNSDEKGRKNIFSTFPKYMPRVMSVGRLDLNSEGLLLLTNDGKLSRELELPANGLKRTYKVRVFGKVNEKVLDGLKNGKVVNGVRYGSIIATLEKQEGANAWLNVELSEGKNREIRKVMESIGLSVNRLIRLSYGPFHLGELKKGQIQEVSYGVIKEKLHQYI